MWTGERTIFASFLTDAPWLVVEVQERRLELNLRTLAERSINLIIDETGDPKKENAMDYVKRQYIYNLDEIENSIVAVTAYGVVDNVTFPLMFEVYKLKKRLKQAEVYQTKPEIAARMIRRLQQRAFRSHEC